MRRAFVLVCLSACATISGVDDLGVVDGREPPSDGTNGGATEGGGEVDAPISTDGQAAQWDADASSTIDGDAALSADASDGSNGSGGLDAAREADVTQPPPLTYRAEVLADGPVGYWRLSETTGTTANDETAGNNDGTYAHDFTLGATGAISGDSNKAVRFDPPSAVSLGSRFSFSGRAAFSVELWLNANSVGSGSDYRFAFMKQYVGSLSNRRGYAIFHHSSGLGFERYQAGTNIVAFAPLPPNGQFTHVVGTYDGATTRIYTNGVLRESKADTRNVDAVTDVALIGAANTDGTDGTYGFDGVIDEVAVYDKALSIDRIVVHYNRGSGK